MLPFRRNARAFTLIELLIVIAIILILIAIALPNFLEAQIRAKVTRVRADMRSVHTALEAYYTDYRQYPSDGDDLFASNPIVDFDVHLRLRVLTTPVAHITELPIDPFHGEKIGYPGEDFLFPGPPPYTYSYNTFGSYFGDPTNFQPPNSGKPDNFGLTSIGPSLAFDSLQGPIQYAPTNGSKSAGDILLQGGNRTLMTLN